MLFRSERDDTAQYLESVSVANVNKVVVDSPDSEMLKIAVVLGVSWAIIDFVILFPCTHHHHMEEGV